MISARWLLLIVPVSIAVGMFIQAFLRSADND